MCEMKTFPPSIGFTFLVVSELHLSVGTAVWTTISTSQTIVTIGSWAGVGTTNSWRTISTATNGSGHWQQGSHRALGQRSPDSNPIPRTKSTSLAEGFNGRGWTIYTPWIWLQCAGAQSKFPLFIFRKPCMTLFIFFYFFDSVMNFMDLNNKIH